MSTAQGNVKVTAMSQRSAALVSGLGMLAMTIVAAVANLAIIQPAILPGDAAATAAAIVASGTGFPLAALGLVVVAILDVVVAWGLYELFRPVHSGLSLLGGWLRLAYAAIFAVAISQLFGAVRVAGSDSVAALRLVEGFDDGWMVGQIFFGLHLVVVGVLAWRSTFVHWIFGLLLVIAGAGYLFDGAAVLAIPAYGLELAMYTFAGEMVFLVWLLVRGFRRK